MGSKTGIAWTEKTWNPFQGCHKVSPGCLLPMKHHKGGKPSEWPQDLRVREMPA